MAINENTQDKIVDLYRECGSMAAVAGSLGVALMTVSNHLRLRGVEIPRKFQERKESKFQSTQRGCLAKWIRKNPHESLLGSTRTDCWKIAKASGCSIGSVANYVSRRRIRAAKLPRNLPNLQAEKVMLRSMDEKGKYFYFVSGALEDYRAFVHPLVFTVFINGVLRTGECVQVEIPLETLWRRIEEGRKVKHGR